MTTNELTKQDYLTILEQLEADLEQAQEAKLYATELVICYEMAKVKKQLENAQRDRKNKDGNL